MLKPFDIVVVAAEGVDADVCGKRGHIIGLVEDTQIGVFIYDLEQVWCLRPGDVVPTGARDEEAERQSATASAIRVNSKGEIVG